MKTEYRKVNLKDNVTTAAVLIASLVAIFGTIVDSSDARADYAAVQQMDVLVISASRAEPTDIVRMDTIVVTAPRETGTLVASN